jgi:hypothetical protein
VGNFVAIIPCPGATAEAEGLFRRAIHGIQARKQQVPNSTIFNGWSCAVSFPRWNGSGSSIVSDPRTGSWLTVVGTCFHPSGDSSPESLLRHYLSTDVDRLCRDLEGFFVVIVGDGRTREITVITDVIGSCHLYVRQLGSAAALSTSSLVLACLGDVSPDPMGCQEFLGTGVIYEDRTIYREVKKLPPATIVKFSRGTKIDQQQYWAMSRLSPESLTGKKATDTLWQALLSAATRINKQFDNVACDLTGGYDSRVIAAAFVSTGKKFVTVVSGPPESADVLVSRGLAAMLGMEHLHYAPPEGPITTEDLKTSLRLTDGEYDLVEYANIARIHRDLSQRFQISINGSFGEVARGYWWELLIPRIGACRRLDSRKLASRRYAASSCITLFEPQLRLDLVEHIASVIDRTIVGLYALPNTFQMDAAYLGMRMQRWQGRIASSTNQIWPCLSPFMFRSVLETTLQAGFATRERSLLVRRMLAKYQPEIADYPLEHGYPALPVTSKTLWRFWPLVPCYGRKIIQRLNLQLGTEREVRPTCSPRLQLWKTDEIRSLLIPASMKTAVILEPSAVAAFLNASREPGFLLDGLWNRLLSLEMALTASLTPRSAPTFE